MERSRCEAITELIGEALAGVDGGVGSVRTAPIITGKVPVDDVLGLCVALPNGVFGRVDGSRDSDLWSGVWSGHGEFDLLLKSRRR
jgi:hypothetical protein